MKRADADTGARAVATASVVAVFFASPVSMNTTNRKGKTMYAILRFQKKTGGKLLNTQNFVDQETMRGDAIDSMENTQIQSQIFFERGSSAICLVAT